MKHLFPAYLFFIFFVSCKSKPENKEQAPSVLPPASMISPVSNDSSVLSNNTTGVTLNPAHGQPGHRCDITVGAPLNGPAATNSPQSTVASNPVIVPPNLPKINTNANATTATLNPKHGEPGHRCDISVGAPLNSKPTQ